jgi:imidazoleglycerol phosphate dehydratase HisB
MAFSSEEIIGYFNKIKYPYNINLLTQNFVSKQLDFESRKKEWVKILVDQRNELAKQLSGLKLVEKVFPSDANFLLVKVPDADLIYSRVIEEGIVVRNRNTVSLCLSCLRITVGTNDENEALLKALENLSLNFFPNKKGLSPISQHLSSTHLPLSFGERAGERDAEERKAVVKRTTNETDIFVSLDIDGTGKTDISTGLGFFDHLLDQIGRHSGMDLTIHVKGDLHIDEHHTIEDTAIALGEALSKALGSKRGIERYGFCLPMDDCLCSVALDFGGRAWLVFDATFKREKIGDVPTEMFQHFFKSLSDAAKMNLNIKAEGENEHHKAEGIFKALARAIKMAIRRDIYNNELPSTKGVL